MVASSSADIYTPFPHIMHSEDGPQSSEEGSGLHSPVFGAPYSAHGDSLRFSDVQHNMGAPQYDYGHSLSQQTPMHLSSGSDGLSLDHPASSSARHAHYQQHYPSLPTRNHLGIDFPVQQPPVANRIPAAPHHSPHIDFRYSPTTERRLPGGPSHDPSYTARPSGSSSTMPIESSHRASVPSSSARSDTSPAAEASTSARESRKEISSVVIACRQCRGRKIRCDSTRPVCNNCVRRSNPCEYDSVPKRRGPDKRPGTRQRSCKKRPADGSVPPPPKRKRTATTTTERPTTEQRELPPSRIKENLQHDTKPRLSPTHSRHLDRHPHQPQQHHQQQQHHQHQDPHYTHMPQHPHQHPHSQATPSPTDLRISDQDPYKNMPYRRQSPYTMYDQGSYNKPSYPRQLDVNTFQFPDTANRNHIPTSPTIEAEQWNKILASHPLNHIASEINFIINNTGNLLSCINEPYLIKRLYNDNERLRIQPAFILSLLAMAKLSKSSSLEDGQMGLSQAMMLAHDAHSAFQEAMRSNWHGDHTLAEAALVLALFESSAYPNHSATRATDALITLDSVIRNLSLTLTDTNDNEVSRFTPNTVPMVLCDSSLDDYAHHDRKCSCFPPGSREPPDYNSNRGYVLPWDPTWSPEEVRQEEIRRVCWSALTLISEYVARCEAFDDVPPHFYLCEPSHFGLLFPGEVIDRASPSYRATDSLSPKESIWALYCRSMLLWNFCNRFRQPAATEERAEQAHEAFLEAQAIEDSLYIHRCNLDTTLIYNTREYIHNTRMLVTLAFRSFHDLDNNKTTPGPVFKRKQAEEWLFYEDQVITRVNQLISQLSSSAGYQLTRRPYRINWFINQLQICLVLWGHDPSLDDALKLAKSILNPIDVLNALWPSPAIEEKCNVLRQQLIEACTARNIEHPFPPTYTVPAYIRHPQ